MSTENTLIPQLFKTGDKKYTVKRIVREGKTMFAVVCNNIPPWNFPQYLKDCSSVEEAEELIAQHRRGEWKRK